MPETLYTTLFTTLGGIALAITSFIFGKGFRQRDAETEATVVKTLQDGMDSLKELNAIFKEETLASRREFKEQLDQIREKFDLKEREYKLRIENLELENKNLRLENANLALENERLRNGGAIVKHMNA
jgi:hypothetical protein